MCKSRDIYLKSVYFIKFIYLYRKKLSHLKCTYLLIELIYYLSYFSFEVTELYHIENRIKQVFVTLTL